MVQPEDIDSGHSNFQLGARSGRYHHNLGRRKLVSTNHREALNCGKNVGAVRPTLKGSGAAFSRSPVERLPISVWQEDFLWTTHVRRNQTPYP